jgi:uncharacterized protein (DUF885 family)
MRKWLILAGLLAAAAACQNQAPAPAESQVQIIADEYIGGWVSFYPSRAYASGKKESAFAFENFSSGNISGWVDLNRRIQARLAVLSEDLSFPDRIDRNLLRRQIEMELDQWSRDKVQEQSPYFYSGLISQALTHVLVRKDLTEPEKWEAVKIRLEGVSRMCRQAQGHLVNGQPHNTMRSLPVLEGTGRFYRDTLPGIVASWKTRVPDSEVVQACGDAASLVEELAEHVRALQPQMTHTDIMGEDEYARKLLIFTGLDLSPEKLEEIAETEIRTVRGLMAETSRIHWGKACPGRDVPEEFNVLLDRALSDMEADRMGTQQEFLQEFIDLIDQAEDFIREQDIATLPSQRTLVTRLSPPHFAGAAVGGVYSAGPFNPEADTLFYLPSIPDDAPDDVKEGFYRSFNTHFNTIIVPHEIYPGHYMQLKIASTHPRMVRSLFGDGLYIEGWATLCEIVALEAGWHGDIPLDRLAHLRKRLENAVRAYVSTKVHCRGWNQDQVTRFAVEEGLLAPQFAVNLWDRVTASPLQLTSYFLGFNHFKNVLAEEKERLGNNFSMQVFSDTILQAGAVPLDFLAELLREES